MKTKPTTPAPSKVATVEQWMREVNPKLLAKGNVLEPKTKPKARARIKKPTQLFIPGLEETVAEMMRYENIKNERRKEFIAIVVAEF